MTDILIIGGFNWLGFELTKMFIERDLFSNVIIIDAMKDYLSKDNKIKRQFDNYAHLYDENIFMYNINIKDKDDLAKVYEKHNIKSVVNNVKFNRHFTHDDNKDILHGYANIVKLNETYSISKYIYLIQTYTHDKLLFKQQKQQQEQDRFLEENFVFNHSAFMINEDKGHLVNLPDYIFGNKCYDSSNIFFKLANIVKIKSPLYIPCCSAYFLCDDLLLMLIYELLFTDINEKRVNEVINENVSGPHSYKDIYGCFQSKNNRIVFGEKDKSSEPRVPDHNIEKDSLLGKYLHSLNSIIY